MNMFTLKHDRKQCMYIAMCVLHMQSIKIIYNKICNITFVMTTLINESSPLSFDIQRINSDDSVNRKNDPRTKRG